MRTTPSNTPTLQPLNISSSSPIHQTIPSPNPTSESSQPSHHHHPATLYSSSLVFVLSSLLFSSHHPTHASPPQFPSHPKPLTMPLSAHPPPPSLFPSRNTFYLPLQDKTPFRIPASWITLPPLLWEEKSAALPLVWCHVSLQRRNSSSRVPVASAECLRNLFNRLSSRTLLAFRTCLLLGDHYLHVRIMNQGSSVPGCCAHRDVVASATSSTSCTRRCMSQSSLSACILVTICNLMSSQASMAK